VNKHGKIEGPRLRSVDLNAVAPLRPADLTAGRVASKGEEWKPRVELPSHILHWDAPPPMVPFHDVHGTDVDLTGKKIGRLTVIGVLDRDGGAGSMRWVVRCTCGDYEVRKPQALKAALNVGVACETSFCCFYCRHQQHIRRRYSELGERPLSEFLDGTLQESEAPKRSPEQIIASWIPSSDRSRLAKQISASLRKAGYKIVRGGS
jgi:hypothetical protein